MVLKYSIDIIMKLFIIFFINSYKMTALLVALNYLKPKEYDHLKKKNANG
jgi:hypothetical protein